MKSTPVFWFKEPHILSGMPKDTPMLLALSGGADSRVLLHLLASYAEENGTPLAVAHLNHGIRGAEADRDEDFCRSLAGDYSLPFFSRKIDVPALAGREKLGLEEAARKARYAFLNEIMKEHSIPILATAHNATDNAETLLFHMARGSGMRGLTGIPEVRQIEGGILIRPLLEASKEEILSFASGNSLAFVTDSTNEDVGYARNRIRKKILPELLAINTKTVYNIGCLTKRAKADDEYLSSLAVNFLEENPEGVPCADCLSLPSPIRDRVLLLFLERNGAAPTSVLLESLLSLIRKEKPHSSLSLGAGKCAVIENGRLYCPAGSPEPSCSYEIFLTEGVTPIPGGRGCFLLSKKEAEREISSDIKNTYQKSAKIDLRWDPEKDTLCASPRKAGDRILSGGHHKDIRKLMNEKKLPLPIRSSLPVVRLGEEILWVPTLTVRDGLSAGAGEAYCLTFFYRDSEERYIL